MVTLRQQAVLDFICAFARKHRIGPSVREIQAHFRFASPNAAHCHVTALRKKGLLMDRRRGWRVAQPMDIEPALPVFGTIPAGLPVNTTQDADEVIPISETVFGMAVGTRVFGLRVKGNSMSGAGINDGDFVFLVERNVRDGDIVAALIDGQSTLKRYVERKGEPFLHAENPDYHDLRPAAELTIQGVMIGLLRRGSG